MRVVAFFILALFAQSFLLESNDHSQHELYSTSAQTKQVDPVHGFPKDIG